MKKKHRLTALLTSFCLLLSMLPISSPTALTANGTLAGQGTEESPYQIADGADLKAFADKVNGGETGAWAVLTADIVLNEDFEHDKFAVDVDGEPTYDGSATIPDFGQWTPIGVNYTGTFDGGGYVIRGMYINSNVNNTYQGLFGYVGGNAGSSTIQNLGIENSFFPAGRGQEAWLVMARTLSFKTAILLLPLPPTKNSLISVVWWASCGSIVPQGLTGLQLSFNFIVRAID